MDLNGRDLASFCSILPKVELHAHLHGSIRPTTLVELAESQDLASPIFITKSDERSLEECFEIFAIIHRIVTSIDIVTRIAAEVLEDFANDGVRYLELRTTPRPLSDGTSRREYVERLLTVLEEYVEQWGGESAILNSMCGETTAAALIPRLLLSIDRSGTLEDALDTVQIAIEISKTKRMLLGVEFSGNPNRNNFKMFESAFTLARENNLKISVHCGEVDNAEDSSNVLSFRPDRLGHMVVMSPDIEQQLLSAQPPIPIEICPSSNFKTLGLNCHSEHPTIQQWLDTGYPFSINTDDTGVFGTTLSKEYLLVCEAFQFNPEVLVQIATGAVDQIFDSGLKAELKRVFDLNSKKLLESETFNDREQIEKA